MTISPFDLLLLLGTLQGFILASLLWFARSSPQLPNRLLAVLIGLFAIASLNMVALEGGFYEAYPRIRFVMDLLPVIMAMPIGPLTWFYVRSMLEPGFRLGRNERWHFLPVLLDWVPALICWTFLIGLATHVFVRSDLKGWGDIIDQYDMYVDIPRWLSISVYVLLARNVLIRYQPAGRGPEVVQQRLKLAWLRQFLTGLQIFQVVWLLFLIPYVLPGLRPDWMGEMNWYLIYVPMTVLIYWFGLKGYLHARLSALTERKKATTTLPAETVDKAAGLLKKAMEVDQLYTDPDLTLEKLMHHTHLDQKTVSHVLNQHLDKSFNAFVNGYRIEAVKQRLVAPASSHLTITGIAFECGFNSQATFQRAFKQFTGVSPSAYLAQQTSVSVKKSAQV